MDWKDENKAKKEKKDLAFLKPQNTQLRVRGLAGNEVGDIN